MKKLMQYFEESGNTWIPQMVLQRENYAADNVIYREKQGIQYASTAYYAGMEEEIARRLIDKLLEKAVLYSKEEIDFYVDWFESISKIKLAEEQRNAVHMAVNNTLSVLTGGPGTGKTCVLKCIDFTLSHLGRKRISFCAPTGKAARRITESVGKPAKTVQKEMGYSPNSKKLKVLIADLLINDESSIMDMETLYYFLCAVDNGTNLLFVGDVEQLPSVGPGAILRDIIDSGVIPVTKLEETFRQANESGLFDNIQRIKKGRSELVESEDFHFLETPSVQAQKLAIATYLKAVKKYGRENVVCLTPYRRKGDTCSNTLNMILQDMLNPIGRKPFLKAEVTEVGDTEKRKVIYQVDDPVMQLVNRKECANGDVGKIISVSEKGVTVLYDETNVFYPLKDLGQITLAYAMSIHKSQGSEYLCVIMLALPEHKDMLNRNMIYTGVTRAKTELVLLGNKEIIKKSLNIEAGYDRITFLSETIRNEYRKRKLLQKGA